MTKRGAVKFKIGRLQERRCYRWLLITSTGNIRTSYFNTYIYSNNFFVLLFLLQHHHLCQSSPPTFEHENDRLNNNYQFHLHSNMNVIMINPFDSSSRCTYAIFYFKDGLCRTYIVVLPKVSRFGIVLC